MQRPLIWAMVNAAILVIGLLAALIFNSHSLMITLIVVGFLAAVIATVEGVFRYRGQSPLPLWYVIAGVVTAGGFVSWLFSAMGEVNFLGLLIPVVGVIGLFVVARKMAADEENEPSSTVTTASRAAGEPAEVS